MQIRAKTRSTFLLVHLGVFRSVISTDLIRRENATSHRHHGDSAHRGYHVNHEVIIGPSGSVETEAHAEIRRSISHVGRVRHPYHPGDPIKENIIINAEKVVDGNANSVQKHSDSEKGRSDNDERSFGARHFRSNDPETHHHSDVKQQSDRSEKDADDLRPVQKHYHLRQADFSSEKFEDDPTSRLHSRRKSSFAEQSFAEQSEKQSDRKGKSDADRRSDRAAEEDETEEDDAEKQSDRADEEDQAQDDDAVKQSDRADEEDEAQDDDAEKQSDRAAEEEETEEEDEAEPAGTALAAIAAAPALTPAAAGAAPAATQTAGEDAEGGAAEEKPVADENSEEDGKKLSESVHPVLKKKGTNSTNTTTEDDDVSAHEQKLGTDSMLVAGIAGGFLVLIIIIVAIFMTPAEEKKRTYRSAPTTTAYYDYSALTK